MRLILVTIFLLCIAHVGGQSPTWQALTRTDEALQKAFEKRLEQSNIRVLVKSQASRAELEQAGLQVGSRFGSLYTADLNLDHLPQLLEKRIIESIQYFPLEQPTMDSVKFHTNTFGVQKGWGGIERAYQGEGIILGIVDSGIDYLHKEFRDDDDNSRLRIHSVWAQWDESGNAPDSFEYGSVYSRSELEDALEGNREIPDLDYDPTERGGLGHGTHVAGIAAGLQGMAPKAEIIAVSTTWESAAIIDGVKYVFDEAKKAGKPCVVNLSLGSMYDLHDGTGERAEAYQKLADYGGEGGIIVAAAGNSGSSLAHWGHFEMQENKVYSSYFYGDPVHLVMAIPDSLAAETEFRLRRFAGDFNYEEEEFSNLKESGLSRWFSVAETLQDTFRRVFREGNEDVGSFKAFANPLNTGSEYHFFELEIDDRGDVDVRQDPPKANGIDLYRLEVKGKGSFNAWLMFVSRTYTGSFAESVADPSAIGAPAVDNYQAPNDSFTILSPAVYPSTFCVGAFVNRWSYIDDGGNRRPARWNRDPNGAYADFSSKGPSVDGRLLPEISAPGQNVFAAIPSYYSGWSPRVLDGEYANKSGTSMSAPVTSGAIALYLEKFPMAKLKDIREAFLNNALQDEFTASFGELPNNYWGHGKLDVYKTITGGIFFSTSEESNYSLKIFPNPANDQLHLGGIADRIQVISSSGKLVIYREMQDRISVGALPKGVYLIRAEKDGHILQGRFLR